MTAKATMKTMKSPKHPSTVEALVDAATKICLMELIALSRRKARKERRRLMPVPVPVRSVISKNEAKETAKSKMFVYDKHRDPLIFGRKYAHEKAVILIACSTA